MASKLYSPGIQKSSVSSPKGGTAKQSAPKKAVGAQTGLKTLMKPNSLKSPVASGHTMGKIPGNMMGHSSKTTPFMNTGMQPKGGKIAEVSLAKVKSSNAHNPGALQHQSAQLGKLDASSPYPTPKVGSWTGGSGMAGGAGAKTRKG